MAAGSSSRDFDQSEFDQLDLDTIPMLAVNVSARMHLSKLLNIEQTLPSSKQLPRDYRGLAELMGFEYTDIRNFQRSREPAKEIIEAWESTPGSSVGALVQMLKELERFDILEEVFPMMQKNIITYVKSKCPTNFSQPLQVAEISSCRLVDFQPDHPEFLSLDDGVGGLQYFDAYVCYADNDLSFVKSLSQELENADVGLKLFIRDRDLLLGKLEYDAYVRLIKERCRRVLVILSPEFISSPECEFQAKFAAGLGIEQRSNKIIPIVYKACDKIPIILSCLSKVDFTRPILQEWAWKKIVGSLRAPKHQSFVTEQQMLPAPTSLLQLPAPVSISQPHFSSSRLQIEPSTSPIVEEYVSEEIIPNANEPAPSTSSGIRKQKWFRSWKNKFQNTSSTSSGFHSETTISE